MLLCALLLLLLLAAPAAGHTLPGKLTLADIARATQEGGNVRLATALQRPRVSFAALGGSITTGHGATTHNRSWWPTFERLVRARGALGDRELAFHNGAVAATEPDFAALCLNTLLPADVDVVFVEFDVNCPGSTPEDTLRRGGGGIRCINGL